MKVAVHADITDEGQTVSFIDIGTTATDKQTGTHESQAAEKDVFSDTVSYIGLTPGKTYTVKGTLMDADTGKELLIGEQPVTSEKKFIPETANGTVVLDFMFNSAALAGKTVVVFEDLYQEDVRIASHADIKDEDQSIYVIDIATTAKDKDTGTQEAEPKTESVLIDTVEYTGLIKGETYILKGILMDAETGEEVLIGGNNVTSETEFKAKASDGMVEVMFMFESTDLAGRSTVVFEDLYHEGVKVASHADLNDTCQTVTFYVPQPEPTPEPEKPTPVPEKPEETPKTTPTPTVTPTPTKTTTPTVTPTPTETPMTTKTGKTTGKTLTAKPVQTGDNSHMGRYLAAIVIASAVGVTTAVIRKKRK